MSTIKTNKGLPKNKVDVNQDNLEIKTEDTKDEPFDDILYEIGLSLRSVRVHPKRRLHNKPLIVFTLIALLITTRTASIITTEEDIQTLLYVGDVGHFFDLKLHYNIGWILASIQCLSFQLIHYLNHRNGIQNKFIGETHELSEEEIKKLKKFYVKICKIIKKKNNYPIPIACAILTLTPLFLYTILLNTLVFGIPHCIHYMIFGYYIWNFIDFQIIQFYIISKYLRLRAERLDQILCEIREKKRFLRIRKSLHSFDSLYKEINEYNTTFWSKFLFAFWLTFGIIVWVMFITVFLSLPLMVRIVFIYGVLELCAVYLFTILTAASVNYSVNKYYKSLNSLGMIRLNHKAV